MPIGASVRTETAMTKISQFLQDDASKKSKEPTISRRSAIAGAAAITLTVKGAEAGAPDDPILPVLETFRLAQQALTEALKAADLPTEQWQTRAYIEAQNIQKDAYSFFKKAQLDLLTTRPTTRAGLASLLIRLGQPTHTDQPNGEPGLLVEALCWHDEPTREAACRVLNRLGSLVLTIT